MQDKTISVLTDDEMQFANDLQLICMDKNTAKILTYLCLVGPATSRQLELAADMRQPDVSRGLKFLRPYVRTSSAGRQIVFTIEKPIEAVDACLKKMTADRKAQDEAGARVKKIIGKPESKKAKNSKKAKQTEDPEVTLDV